MSSVIDKFWHRTLRRPYHLAQTIDQGQGTETVVMLHGIGRTGQVWQHVLAGLVAKNIRVVAFDLLGFGASPKPDWLDYDVDDHADAVIASITSIKTAGPVTIVGHSMGCLVAVKVARRRPDLVQHLVLYEMPLYEGLPQKRRYRLRTELYFGLYNRLMNYQPTFDPATAKLAERMAKKIVGFEVSRESWVPFIRSLEHTIMKQTAAGDIKHLPMPMDVIYGTFDMFVIRGKPQQILGGNSDLITAHTIRERHTISPKASRFLVERIMVVLGNETGVKHD